MNKVVNNEKAQLGTNREGGFRLDPQSAGHIERGFNWITKKDFDQAIAEFNEAIRREPGCSVAYTHRAFAWSCKREYGKAIADYDRAVLLDPKSAAAYNDRAWLRQLVLSRNTATPTVPSNPRSGRARFPAGKTRIRSARLPPPTRRRAISDRR